MGRQFMASGGRRRRGQRRLGLVALVAVALVGGGGWWLLAGSGETSDGDNPQVAQDAPSADEASSDRASTTGESDRSTRGESASQLPRSLAGENQPAAEPGAVQEEADRANGSTEPADADSTEASSSRSNTSPSRQPSQLVLEGEAPATGDEPAQSVTSGSNGADQGQSAPSEPKSTETSRLSNDDAAQSINVSGTAAEGLQLIEQDRLIEGRRVLSRVLFDRRERLSASEANHLREVLDRVNKTLVFSTTVRANDPLVGQYRVQSGDRLVKIARQYEVPYPFIEQINGIQARSLQAGQTIKVLQGPIHARIVKSRFVMDLYVHNPDGQRIYIKSFPVGLGEENSTPTGRWRVTEGKKVKNPDWRNPRTGEYFKRDDPDNPIGEYWLAITGIGPNTKNETGYGIHGTIEPESVGRQMSMGCVRLRSDDIVRVFHMLMGGASTVQIME
jgi:LysM repeat protein